MTFYHLFQEDDVETTYGTLRVIIQGDRSKPAILTYHDIGLNSTYDAHVVGSVECFCLT